MTHAPTVNQDLAANARERSAGSSAARQLPITSMGASAPSAT